MSSRKGEKLVKTLVSLMKSVGENRELSGEMKKRLVLIRLRDALQLDDFLEDLIVSLIDVLIEVDNGELVFNPKVKRALICC